MRAMNTHPTTEHWIATAKGRLFARCWRPVHVDAAKAPIVLFHDSLGCVELWRDFPERLSITTGSIVIAYDRLGFGRSDPHAGSLDAGFIRQEADDGFAAVRDRFGLGTFIAFGHSVGGAMAAVVASSNPGSCRALVTESAQAFVEPRTLEGIRDASRAFEERDQFARLRKYHGDKAAWVLDAWVNTWLGDAFRGWRLDDHAPQLPCPVLAIHGELDEFGSPRHPQRIASLATSTAVVKLLADCGHVPHREKAGVVLETVATFLSRYAP